METTDITFEPEKTKERYKRYFQFERRSAFKKTPSLFIVGLSVSLIIIGVFTATDFLWILGTLSISLLGILLLYFLIRFKIAFRQYEKTFEKRASSYDQNFQFSFDYEMIIYQSENTNSEIKWALIKSYRINGKDLYLYLEHQELLDIISEEILGHEKFEKFKAILDEKIRPVPGKK